MVTLCALVSAQTLRSEGDPRNLSPSVGTGGPVGGPTGLFTIYDGQTLRKGEYTFSIAYSNYDRDPGNVDITDVPLSFNLGLSDHLELFFKTDAYRGIKVNSPTNLSSFYLPNSQLYLSLVSVNSVTAQSITLPNQLRSGGIVVQTPLAALAFGFPPTLARVPGGPFFVPFPFVGGPAAGFGFERAAAPFSSTLGPASGGNNNFGAAGNFPGIGSPFGSILPGIILATVALPCTALTGNCAPPANPGSQNPIIAPVSFTVEPSYLPDAPFINRLYGQSSFNDFVVGAKFRLNGVNKPWGIGIIPFYRWWADKADDAQGFNQMQRGAGPGGSIGDFGLTAFMDARMTRSVNISVNGGYILNSNPRSKAFGGGNVALLDRPDEFNTGIGFDFPINRHFQPIAELRSTRYVGGRTPNAFPNNPVEALGGVKIYPRRWWGFGAWYRIHLNQQSEGHINKQDFNVQINNVSGIFVPGRGIVIVPGTTRPATANGIPLGFAPSEDPHGFGFQLFAGHRNAREPLELPNQPPTVSVAANPARVTIAANCGIAQRPVESCTPTSTSVQLSASATDPDGDTLLYTWSTTGGRITGDGPNVTWDLSGVTPGTYTASVEVDDGCGCVAFSSTSVTVDTCSCEAIPTPVPTPEATPVPTPEATPIPAPTATKFDEYGNIKRNDEKARLDNFANELQNQPGAQGYIIGYGGRTSRPGEGQARADRAKDYLVTSRGIDAGRLVTVDGGYKEEPTTELWIVPAGATPPTASPTVDASEVKPAPVRRTPRRAGARRRRVHD